MSRSFNHLERRPAVRELAAFLGVTFVLSWLPALALQSLWSPGSASWPSRLLGTCILYGVTMGWQPLFASGLTRRWFGGPVDLAFRPVTGRFLVASIALPILLAISSAGARLLESRVLDQAPSPFIAITAPSLTVSHSLLSALAVTASLILATVTIYAQCFSEELGWRSYFLLRLIKGLGPRLGLLLHGVFWGIWYAPIFLFASRGDVTVGALRSATFVVTCALLGVFLGWLRLAANSVIPSTIANVTLTLACGLPFILRNIDVGSRGAIYTVAGWAPLTVVAVVLLLGRSGWAARLVDSEVTTWHIAFQRQSGTSDPKHRLN